MLTSVDYVLLLLLTALSNRLISSADCLLLWPTLISCAILLTVLLSSLGPSFPRPLPVSRTCPLCGLSDKTDKGIVWLAPTHTNTTNAQHRVTEVEINILQQKSKCRLCGERDEIVIHFVSQCNKLAWKEYKTKHESARKTILWELCKRLKFRELCKKLKFDHTMVHALSRIRLRKRKFSWILWYKMIT